MLIHELSTAECRDVLTGTNVGRLACARGDQPYIVPVFFYFDAPGVSLYSFSTIGQKIDWMRSNPKVCVEVEAIQDKDHWTTVLVFGRYEEVRDAPGDTEARLRALELFGRQPQWWFPGAGKLMSAEQRPPIVYRIKIDRMTGRRAARPSA